MNNDFRDLVQGAIMNWQDILDGLAEGKHYDSTFLETYGDQIKALIKYHNSMGGFINKYLPVNILSNIRYLDSYSETPNMVEIYEANWYPISLEISYYNYSIRNNELVFNKITDVLNNITLSSHISSTQIIPDGILNKVSIDKDLPVEIKITVDKPFGDILNGPEVFFTDKDNPNYDNIIEPGKVIRLTIPGSIAIGYRHGNYIRGGYFNITKQIVWLIPDPNFNVTPSEIVVESTEDEPVIESEVTISNVGIKARALTISPDFSRQIQDRNLQHIIDCITVVSPSGTIQGLSPDTTTFTVRELGRYQFYINNISSYKKFVDVILNTISRYLLSTDFHSDDNHLSSISGYSSITTYGEVVGGELPVGGIIETSFTEAISLLGQDEHDEIMRKFVYSHCMLPWLHGESTDYEEMVELISDELANMGFHVNLVQEPVMDNGNTVVVSLYDKLGTYKGNFEERSIVKGAGNNPFNTEVDKYGAATIQLNLLLLSFIVNLYNNDYWKGYLTVSPYNIDRYNISPDNISGDVGNLHLWLSMDNFTSSVGVIPNRQYYNNDPVNVTIDDLADIYPLKLVPSGSEYNLSVLRLSDNIWDKVSLIDTTAHSVDSNLLNFGYDIIKLLNQSKLVFGTPNGDYSEEVLNYGYRWVESLNQYKENIEDVTSSSGDLTLFEPFYFMESLFLQNSGQSSESSRSPGIDKLSVTMTGFYDLYHCIREIESFDPNNIFAKVGSQYMRETNLNTVDRMILRSSGMLNFHIDSILGYEYYGNWSIPINEFPKDLLQALMEINRPHSISQVFINGSPWFYRLLDPDDYDFEDPQGFDYLERPFGDTHPRKLTQFLFPFPGLYELTSQIPDGSSEYNQYCIPIYVLASPFPGPTEDVSGLKLRVINGYNSDTGDDNDLYNLLIKPELPNGLSLGNSDSEFEANGIRVIRPNGYTFASGFNRRFNIQDRF